MDTIDFEIFFAWSNENVAFGLTEDDAIENLSDQWEQVSPFRVARFAVKLPPIELADGGTVSVSGASPAIKIVGGTDTA